ncbi:hypothetical protein LTR56_011510 [Elasticomyces elasticus]|nr:hypothetical protein LTR22_020386 [Elasticomyces elasticus]KAK3641064.1 hypothetical protein LTR56_011510 [Elasticomyces elasticus]KAK4930230.1 hypothetical protein LTR49_003264 [Elasticomyces elasticus]KAK5761393.1 hypothetical protein LTS12_008497 [Elasticomyces elasticus]
MDTNTLVSQLAAGFETLQEEYSKLSVQHQSLERKLATAREQYNALAKLCSTTSLATPPLSLSSAVHATAEDVDTAAVIERLSGPDSAHRVRAAISASKTIRLARPAEGVKIHSGPYSEEAVCAYMPSISESPLEQDFTIEGKPSQLGCPFAAMAGKKLSSHAASVLSRYNTRDSGTGGVSSTPLSSVSRVNGRESLVGSTGAGSRRSRRTSFADPIKAEICGLSSHSQPHSTTSPPPRLEVDTQPQLPVLPVEEANSAVCPIRFMDQHSPEEVATYFEKHKHELPRSHEVCVRRYQSNESQIRELDAKYGNLVSMIQGLGQRHKELLPEEPAEEDEEGEGDAGGMSKEGGDKVRAWARSVSAEAVDGNEDAIASPDLQDEDVVGDDERVTRFDRTMREIRVGESPSRPWGISVPAKYLEALEVERSEGKEAVAQPATQLPEVAKDKDNAPPAKCPFGFDKQAKAVPKTDMEILLDDLASEVLSSRRAEELERREEAGQVVGARRPDADFRFKFLEAELKNKELRERLVKLESEKAMKPEAQQQPAFIASSATEKKDEQPRMVFTGPVFIGYGVEDAARILRESGLGGKA